MAVAEALLIVEGSHDAEFAGRLLKAAEYQRLTEEADLPEEWRRLIPTTFPRPGRGIDQPHEVPRFWRRSTGELVMILIAGGDSRLAQGCVAVLDALGRMPESIGFVLDDDTHPDPRRRHSTLLESLARLRDAVPAFPGDPGVVSAGSPRTGVFVLPDNRSAGTLEDLLLDAGKIAYPKLLRRAASFVAEIEKGELTRDDLREGSKPAGVKKQTIAAAVAILKPTRALAPSLHDNRWLDGEALRRPLVSHCRAWLHALLDLPPG